MSEHALTSQEKAQLLHIARQAIEAAVLKKALPEVELSGLPQRLQEEGASFVTLILHGNLRGCIGTLQAYQALALDVQEHAVAAALEDYRFSPVSPDEVPLLEIEISCLTPARSLEYTGADDLIKKLRPRVDGVMLRYGARRATFLPQVWDDLPKAEDFLSRLCLKMGAPADLWRHEKLEVETYQVEEFHEQRKSVL